jgi:hypothetical protein
MLIKVKKIQQYYRCTKQGEALKAVISLLKQMQLRNCAVFKHYFSFRALGMLKNSCGF